MALKPQSSFKKTEVKKIITKNKNENKILNFLIFAPLVLIFFLCPLFFTNLTAQGIGFDKVFLFSALALVSLISWITKSAIYGELTIKKSLLNLFIIFSWLALLVSSFLSVGQKDSFIGSYGNISKSFVTISIFVLFYYLLVNNLNAQKIKILYWSFFSSVFLVIVYSFLQIFGVFILPWSFTHFNNFNPLGSMSSLAMFLAIALPFFVINLSQIKVIHPNIRKSLEVFLKIFVWIGIIISLVALYVLNGFTYWPITIVGVALVLAFFLTKKIGVNSSDLLIPVVIFFVLVALSVLGNLNFIKTDLPAEVSLSTDASFDIAKNSLKENAFFGSGLSTFYYDFNKYKEVSFNESALWNIQFDNASGIFSELISTVGIFGASLIFLTLLVLLYISLFSILKTEAEDLKPIVVSLFSSLVVAILFSLFFSFNNSLISFLMLLLCFGAASVFAIHPKEMNIIKINLKSAPRYAMVLAIIFLIISSGVIVFLVHGVKMYLADVYIKKAVLSQDINYRIEKTGQAIFLAPFQDNYYLIQSNNYLLLAQREAKKENNQNNMVDAVNLSIATAKKALEISPKNVINMKNLAFIYENATGYTSGAIEWADMLYKNILEISPNNPEPYLKMGIINMARANAEKDEEEKNNYIKEAIKNYDEAIAKKINFATAYYAKAIALESQNNTDLSIEELKKAVIADSNNTDYQFELGRLYFNKGITPANLSQVATEEIISGEEKEAGLSVEGEGVGQVGRISRNENINTAEQLFFNILSINKDHANAKYALALLYQKLNEKERATAMIKSLLETLQDEQSIEAVKQQFPGLY